MLERDRYPAGVPCWVDTAQPDPEAAVRFYEGLFGWDFEDRMPADSPGRYFVARLRGRDVAAGGAPEGFEDAVAWLVPMTDEQFPPDAPPHWSTTFSVDDADAIAEKAEKLGGQVLAPPFDAPWVRMTVIADRQGAVFTASKYVPAG